MWRTDLAATEPFWESWFKGLSSKFLSAKGGKLLLLAGTDRLDKELMIGQMQGELQTRHHFLLDVLVDYFIAMPQRSCHVKDQYDALSRYES